MRRAELSARVTALPAAVEAWRVATVNELDSQLHFSQVRAIQTIVTTLCADAAAQLASIPGDDAALLGALLDCSRSLLRAEKCWDYFRSKLDLRRSPAKEALWTADTVAWNCYRPVMEAAVQAGAIAPGALPEPPLTYSTATLSPLTWMRGLRPHDGQTFLLGDGVQTLPFPVIELPWEQLDNPWELMAIHHEVGHDLERDLQLGAPLRAALAEALLTAGAPVARRRVWDGWMSEVFADLVGIQLGGPAFADALATLIAFPPDFAKRFDATDPHPTHYLRPLLLAAVLQTINPTLAVLAEDAARLRGRWLELYGDAPELADYPDDFTVVSGALMDTAFPVLHGRTVRQLMPYEAAHDSTIRAASAYLRTGFNQPQQIEPRHVICAARRAIAEFAPTGSAAADDASLASLRQRIHGMVRRFAPGGVRAAGADRKAALAEFARRLPLHPLEFMGTPL